MKACRSEAVDQFHPGHRKPLMAMIEVTQRCNMACPICYSDATSSLDDIPIEKIHGYLSQLLEVTETPIPVQISGGEPTLRDDLPAIVSMAKGMGYANIELVSNGLRISQDLNYLKALRDSGLTSVYLQFDGLSTETTTRIRGRDMSAIRLQAVEAIGKSGLCCTLAVVLARGINEKEVGPIVQYAVANIDVVRAINFQSATRFKGRFQMDIKGYTMAELLQLIEDETGIPADTFCSAAIGHPECNAMSPVFIVDNQIKPLFKYVPAQEVTAFLADDAREKILALFSGKRTFFYRYLKDRRFWKALSGAAPIFGMNPYNWVRKKHLLLFAKSFMEAGCADRRRMEQCCYALSGEAGVVSFCEYNNHYRFDR